MPWLVFSRLHGAMELVSVDDTDKLYAYSKMAYDNTSWRQIRCADMVSENSTTDNRTEVADFKFVNLGAVWGDQSPRSFSYIPPYHTRQSCNIFGPLCQPGMVTVNASLHPERHNPTTTADPEVSLTTLQCSSYLSAQAVEAQVGVFDAPWYVNDFKTNWWREFGRSDECLSYASLYRSGGEYTLSRCLGNAGVTDPVLTSAKSTTPSQIPGPSRSSAGTNDPLCCGECSLYTEHGDLEVELYYWPDNSIVGNCTSRRASFLESNGQRSVSDVKGYNRTMTPEDQQNTSHLDELQYTVSNGQTLYVMLHHPTCCS